VEVIPGFEKLPPCLEDGRTFEENARQKALHYSPYAPGLVFADDSGISVEALGGAPGVYSARFAGPAASDAANNEKLLQELQELHQRDADLPARGASRPGERAAHYFCVIERGKILTVVEGRADGLILGQPRGAGGFGYDPLFFYPPLGRTFAELSPEEKFAVSHRGEAFRKLLDFLKRR